MMYFDAWGTGNCTHIDDVIDTKSADDTALLMFGTDHKTNRITRRIKSEIRTEAECQKIKIMPVTKNHFTCLGGSGD